MFVPGFAGSSAGRFRPFVYGDDVYVFRVIPENDVMDLLLVVQLSVFLLCRFVSAFMICCS